MIAVAKDEAYIYLKVLIMSFPQRYAGLVYPLPKSTQSAFWKERKTKV
jgi:hypothetical protein